MTQTPEAAFRAMLARLREAEARYADARVALGEAGRESTAADKVLTKWLVRSRSFLTLVCGNWPVVCLQIGLPLRRSAVPKRMALRLQMAAGLVAFFARDLKSNLPQGGLTAEHGGAVHERLERAQRELRLARVECRQKKRARDAAERALRRKMRQVVVILGISIRADDRRWADFGLRQPQRGLLRGRGLATPAAAASESITLPEVPLKVLPAPADDAAAA